MSWATAEGTTSSSSVLHRTLVVGSAALLLENIPTHALGDFKPQDSMVPVYL